MKKTRTLMTCTALVAAPLLMLTGFAEPEAFPVQEPEVIENCVQERSYWSSLLRRDSGAVTGVESIRIGCEGKTITMEEANALLTQSTRGCDAAKVAQELIAAILNIEVNGVEPGAADVVLAEARDFLCATPPGSKPGKDLKKVAKILRKDLQRFNQGRLTAPSCNGSGSGGSGSGGSGKSGSGGSGSGGSGSGGSGSGGQGPRR